jgi:hypothetical protein
MMATEKLEELTIDQLKKKEKEANKVMIISLIIFSVCLMGLIIIKPDWIGVTIPLLAPGIIYFKGRKKIRKELKKRESKV